MRDGFAVCVASAGVRKPENSVSYSSGGGGEDGGVGERNFTRLTSSTTAYVLSHFGDTHTQPVHAKHTRSGNTKARWNGL